MEKQVISYLRTFYFDLEWATHYSPEDWVGIVAREIEEMELSYSEEYGIGVITFGEEIVLNHVDVYTNVLNKYIEYVSEDRIWYVFQYLFMRYNG